MSELLQKDTIKGDFDAKFKDALGKISDTDKKNMKDKIVGMLEGDKFPEYLDELDKAGLKHMGSQDTNRLLTSLTLLDPEQAKKTSQQLMMNSLTYQLNNMDPSKVSEANRDEATKDILSTVLSFIKSGSNAIRTSMGTLEKFLAEVVGDKTKLTEMRKVIEDALGDGRVSPAADDAINKINGSIDKFVTDSSKSEFRQFFSTMASSGFLGSLAGGISLFSGIYQLVGNGGALGQTWQQRLGAANQFVSFLSMGSHFVTLGDKLLTKVGTTGLADFMGLSETLPSLWKEGSKGFFNFEVKSPFGAELRTEIAKSTATIVNEIELTKPPQLDRFGVPENAYEGVADLLTEKVDRSLASKIAGSALKIVGAVTDLVGGVVDIVLGAFTIKAGVESNDGLTKAAGATQVLAGTAFMTAGAIGTASLFGTVGIASALTGPLFLVGTVFAAAGLIIGIFIDHNKKQAATDKEGQWFIDLAQDGLLQSDWGDKVEFARYSLYEYGSRDAPDDQSLYNYQKAEWDHFRTTPDKDGSSINRLDNKLHLDFNGDNKNMPGHEYDDIVPFAIGV